MASNPQYQQELTNLFRNGDPKARESHIHPKVIDELESYMTAVKRAPGISADQIQPSDFHEFARAIFLCDLLPITTKYATTPKTSSTRLWK